MVKSDDFDKVPEVKYDFQFQNNVSQSSFDEIPYFFQSQSQNASSFQNFKIL